MAEILSTKPATCLEHHLHDRLRGTCHSLLLVARRGSALRVEQLGCLSHGHRQDLSLHVSTPASTACTSTSTSAEHLEGLHRGSSSHSFGAETGRIAAAVSLAMGILNVGVVQ